MEILITILAWIGGICIVTSLVALFIAFITRKDK
jgi:hypothetical protein